MGRPRTPRASTGATDDNKDAAAGTYAGEGRRE